MRPPERGLLRPPARERAEADRTEVEDERRHDEVVGDALLR